MKARLYLPLLASPMPDRGRAGPIQRKEARSMRVGLCRTQMVCRSRGEANEGRGGREQDTTWLLGTLIIFLRAYPGIYCKSYIEDASILLFAMIWQRGGL